MKLIKLLPVMAIASVCVAGQVHAAQDPLMMPEQPAAPLTAEQQEISLAVPSEEVKAVVSEFAAFQLGMSNALIQDDNRVMSGQQRYTNNVLYYMNVRRDWYITSHRYKKDSYARVALDRLYLDYKEFFTNHTTVSDMNKAEYENQILAILEKNTANMSNDELRFYMNEMVIYSLKEAMRVTTALNASANRYIQLYIYERGNGIGRCLFCFQNKFPRRNKFYEGLFIH